MNRCTSTAFATSSLPAALCSTVPIHAGEEGLHHLSSLRSLAMGASVGVEEMLVWR